MDTQNILAAIIGGAVVTVLEHFLIQPLKAVKVPDNRRWLASLASAFSLILPMLLLRELALQIAVAISQQYDFANFVRADTFANLYALFALIWGVAWTIAIHPAVYRTLNGNGSKGPNA